MFPKKPVTMAAAPPARAEKPVPVDLMEADLRVHDGTVAGQDLWLAADGFVFNVEKGRDFYGPGAGYAPFAGRDATVGLATMEIEPAKWTKKAVAELSSAELDTLSNWVGRFRQKYDVVGFLNDGARPMTLAEARSRGYA